MRTSTRWLLLFVFGAAIGTALDHLHVSFGVLDYPGSWPFAQRPWVPPLFGSAGVIFVYGHQRTFRAPGESSTPLRAGLATLLFALVYFATAVFHAHPRALLLGMVLGFIPFIWGLNYLRLLAHGAVTAIGGVLFETTLVKIQAFRYIAPGPLPVPIWLGGLYLYVAVATRQIDLAFFRPASGDGESSKKTTTVA